MPVEGAEAAADGHRLFTNIQVGESPACGHERDHWGEPCYTHALGSVGPKAVARWRSCKVLMQSGNLQQQPASALSAATPWPPQEVRVQERLQCLDAGSVPSAISVLLLDEMADTCQAGGALIWAPKHTRKPRNWQVLGV
mgnify:FL=1